MPQAPPSNGCSQPRKPEPKWAAPIPFQWPAPRPHSKSHNHCAKVLAGVVGTMKGDGTEKLRDVEQRAILEAKDGASHNWGPGDYVLEDVLIPRRQSISDAAGVGGDLDVATGFDPL